MSDSESVGDLLVFGLYVVWILFTGIWNGGLINFAVLFPYFIFALAYHRVNGSYKHEINWEGWEL